MLGAVNLWSINFIIDRRTEFSFVLCLTLFEFLSESVNFCVFFKRLFTFCIVVVLHLYTFCIVVRNSCPRVLIFFQFLGCFFLTSVYIWHSGQKFLSKNVNVGLIFQRFFYYQKFLSESVSFCLFFGCLFYICTHLAQQLEPAKTVVWVQLPGETLLIATCMYIINHCMYIIPVCTLLIATCMTLRLVNIVL